MEEATYDPGHVGRCAFVFVKINGRDSVGGDDGSYEGENDGYSVVLIVSFFVVSSKNVPAVVSFKSFLLVG